MSTTRFARLISANWKQSVCVLLAAPAIFLIAGMALAQPRRDSELRVMATPADTRLIGDWDLYVMLGAAPNGGFEARRRMGFAHFDGPSASGAWFKRRSGARLYGITKVTVAGDNLAMSLDNGREIVGTVKGNSIEGRILSAQICFA